MSVARDIQQIGCSTQTGQHSPLQGSCCPIWALQHNTCSKGHTDTLMLVFCLYFACIMLVFLYTQFMNLCSLNAVHYVKL